MKTISTAEALERIRMARFHADHDLEGRAKAGRSLAHLISHGQLSLYAERGRITGHTIYPADPEWPANELDSWEGQEEVIGAQALFAAATDYGFETGELHCVIDDTRIAVRPDNLAFPRLWRGCCVTIELSGMGIDPSALDEAKIAATRGAPPRFDWEAYHWAALDILRVEGGVKRRAGHGELSQAELERRMAQWCLLQWGEEPSDASIRTRVRKAIRDYEQSARGTA